MWCLVLLFNTCLVRFWSVLIARALVALSENFLVLTQPMTGLTCVRSSQVVHRGQRFALSWPRLDQFVAIEIDFKWLGWFLYSVAAIFLTSSTSLAAQEGMGFSPFRNENSDHSLTLLVTVTTVKRIGKIRHWTYPDLLLKILPLRYDYGSSSPTLVCTFSSVSVSHLIGFVSLRILRTLF